MTRIPTAAPATAFAILLLLALPSAEAAQLDGSRTPAGCIHVAGAGSRISASGRLSLESVAGPPNYGSIEAGDADERAFILELPDAVCIDDGGDFAEPSQRLAAVQVGVTDDALLAVLRAAVGGRVTVSGLGFASNNARHRAPLVIQADRVTVG